MDERESTAQYSATIKTADQSGVIVLPTLIGLGYGIYLLVSENMTATNGAALVVLSSFTLLFAPTHVKSKWALIPAYLLGVYMFGVIGCLAIGIAINESSS